jgi:hypothetical protein
MSYTSVVSSQTPIYSLRLPADVREKLQKLADSDGRSLNNFIVKVLRDYTEQPDRTTETPGEYKPDSRDSQQGRDG